MVAERIDGTAFVLRVMELLATSRLNPIRTLTVMTKSGSMNDPTPFVVAFQGRLTLLYGLARPQILDNAQMRNLDQRDVLTRLLETTVLALPPASLEPLSKWCGTMMNKFSVRLVDQLVSICSNRLNTKKVRVLPRETTFSP